MYIQSVAIENLLLDNEIKHSRQTLEINIQISGNMLPT